jgi:hypothetical protein
MIAIIAPHFHMSKRPIQKEYLREVQLPKNIVLHILSTR